MAHPNPLQRLREIRDIQREAVALIPERNRLIRELAKAGAPERSIAAAAGLSPGRINQLRA
jgi:hypothetical protein